MPELLRQKIRIRMIGAAMINHLRTRERERLAADAATRESDKLRAGLATGLYHQLGQVLQTLQFDLSSPFKKSA